MGQGHIKRLAVAVSALLLAATPALARPKIVVSISRSDDTFVNILRQSVENEARSKGDLDVSVVSANNDSATQIRQIEEAIANDAAAVVMVVVDTASAEAAVQKTAAAGVPLVFLNRLPPMDRFDGDVAIVASNDLVAGRLQMRILSDRIGGQGNVVILRGEDGHPAARDRTQGVKEIIASKPGLKIVQEATGNWRREDAEALVTGWLNSGVRIDAIAANNDEMAIGAINALRKAGIPAGRIFVGGVDGTPFALEEIRSGYLTLSLLQNARAQGAQALADAAKFANGEYAQLYDWVPYELILPTNLDKYASR